MLSARLMILVECNSFEYRHEVDLDLFGRFKLDSAC